MRRYRVLAVDLALIMLATVVAQLLRVNLEYSPERLSALLPYLLQTLVIAAVALPVLGTDKVLWRFSGIHDYVRVAVACVVIVLASVGLGFVTDRMAGIARSLPILQGLLMLLLLVGIRVGLRLRRDRRLQHPPSAQFEQPPLETVLVVGLNSVAELFLQSVADYASKRIRVAGVLGRSERHSGREFRSHPVLGPPEELLPILRDLVVHGVEVDRIVVAMPFDQLSPAAQQALLYVERSEGAQVDFFAERIGLGLPSRHSGSGGGGRRPETEGSALFEASIYGLQDSLKRPYWRIKRGADIVVAALAIIATMPLMVVLGLFTAVLLGRPIMFWQQRPGLEGAPFILSKFRSLLGAHDGAGRLLPDALRETAYGRFLRATRLASCRSWSVFCSARCPSSGRAHCFPRISPPSFGLGFSFDLV